MQELMPDGTYRAVPIISSIDPLRISEFNMGGPHFALFYLISNHRWKNAETGDVFDVRGLHDAWEEGRNLMPIVCGSGRMVKMHVTTAPQTSCKPARAVYP